VFCQFLIIRGCYKSATDGRIYKRPVCLQSSRFDHTFDFVQQISNMLLSNDFVSMPYGLLQGVWHFPASVSDATDGITWPSWSCFQLDGQPTTLISEVTSPSILESCRTLQRSMPAYNPRFGALTTIIHSCCIQSSPEKWLQINKIGRWFLLLEGGTLCLPQLYGGLDPCGV